MKTTYYPSLLLLKRKITFILFTAHSPDNSFMGFVIPNRFNSSEHTERKNQAVVYGKNDYMWKVHFLSVSLPLEFYFSTFCENQSLGMFVTVTEVSIAAIHLISSIYFAGHANIFRYYTRLCGNSRYSDIRQKG